MTWQAALYKKFLTRFSVDQYLITPNGIEPAGRQDYKAPWIISRALCRFIHADFSHVPKKQRPAALALHVERMSPFKKTGYAVGWHDAQAQIWLWNAETIDTILASAPNEHRADEARHMVPELAYWQRETNNGLNLFQATQGFDLQYWKDNVLRASQWFAEPPDAEQIRRFARAQSLPVVDIALEPRQPRLRAELNPEFERSWLQQVESGKVGLFWAAVMVSVLVASLQLNRIAQWYWTGTEVEQEIAQFKSSSEALLQARSDARRLRDEAETIAELMRYPSSLATAELVRSRLQTIHRFELISWERNFDQIELTVKGPLDNSLALVQALEIDGIENVKVTVNTGEQQHRISMRLSGFRAGVANVGGSQ